MTDASSVRENTLRLEGDARARALMSSMERHNAAIIAKAVTDLSRAEAAKRAAAEEERRFHRAAKLDAALYAELELQRLATLPPKPSARQVRKAEQRRLKEELLGQAAPQPKQKYANMAVLSKGERERGRRKTEQRHAEELETARQQWLAVAREVWLEDELKRLAPLAEAAAAAGEAEVPEPTAADAERAIPYAIACREMTLDVLLRRDKGSLHAMTARERKEAHRARVRAQAEDEKRRADFLALDKKKMTKQMQEVYEQHQKRLLENQLKWAADKELNHALRRQNRVREIEQMIRFRSAWWMDRAFTCFYMGIPKLDAKGRTYAATDPETGKPLLATLARKPPGEKFYFHIRVGPESWWDYCPAWVPSHDVQIYTEQHARDLLHAHEKSAADPTHSPQQRAGLQQAEILLRNLVRNIAACEPTEAFVYRVEVECDGLRPGAIEGEPMGPKTEHLTGWCGAAEWTNLDKIVNEGGILRQAPLICMQCDGSILEKRAEHIKSCDRCPAQSFLCSKHCKLEHVKERHPDTAAAKRAGKKAANKAAKRAQKLEEAKAIQAAKDADEAAGAELQQLQLTRDPRMSDDDEEDEACPPLAQD